MSERQPSLFSRDDTLLGVCHGLGEDFGFNPLWLRAALAVLFFWNPVVVIGAYFAIGAVVLVSRLVYPNRESRKAEAVSVDDVPVEACNDAEPALAIAA